MYVFCKDFHYTIIKSDVIDRSFSYRVVAMYDNIRLSSHVAKLNLIIK